jgi:hypothetical protein
MKSKKYRYDPEFAYLQIKRDESGHKSGIYLRLPAPPNHESNILHGQWFNKKSHGSLKKAFDAAKMIRNTYGPKIMGWRFMDYGERPRQSFNLNSSGVIGVCLIDPPDSSYTAWRAIWREKVPNVSHRIQRGKDFPFNENSMLEKVNAFQIAVAYRKSMIDTHYIPITEIWRSIMSPVEYETAIELIGRNK